MSDRRRSAFLSMLFSGAGLTISLARNVLLVPIYLHKIPLSEYGAWLATGGALALMLVNDYGLSGVVTQRISASYGAGEITVLGRVAGSAIAIGTVLAVGLAAVSFVLVPFLPGLTTLSESESHTVVMCFMFAIASNSFGVIGGTALSVIRSLQEVTVVGTITVVAEVANVAFILIGLLGGYGLYALAAGLLVRALIISGGGLAGVWYLCARRFGTLIKIEPAAVRDLLGEASRFFLSSIAIRLQAQANVFFVGSILGPESAAMYSLTVRAHDTVMSIIVLVNGSLVPSVTHLLGSGDAGRFRVVVLRLLIFLASMTALAMTVTVILNPSFLNLWVGRSAFAGQSVSILMAVAVFITSIVSIAYDALLAQGKFPLVTRFFVITSILQVVLLASLLRWGVWAAPFVTIVTISVWGTAFWLNVAKDIRVTASEVRVLVWELARVLIVSVSGAAAFALIYPAANSWVALIVEGAICATCLTAACLSASPTLRGIAYEEIGTTFRLFRAT
jgi:O-antigen/teichoic acid export membrane protein